MATEVRIYLEPIARLEDGGTGYRWSACADLDGSGVPSYDGSGATVEDALAALATSLAEALAKR